MNRIFSIDDINEIINKDKGIIDDALCVIEDIKSVASDIQAEASSAPAGAASVDISGAVSNFNSNSNNAVYDDAITKLETCERRLSMIEENDKFFSEQVDDLTKTTNNIKSVIEDLEEFISKTPLATHRSIFGLSLAIKSIEWKKTLSDVNETIDEIRERTKGSEKLSTTFSEDPVNLSTGNFIYNKTDLEYMGAAGFSFRRFYNSINTYLGVLGKDWNTNFEVHLRFEPSKVFEGDEIIVLKEDGKEERFLPVNDEIYTPGGNSLAVLTKTKQGYEYVTLEGFKYIFDEDGIFRRYEDINGQGITLIYVFESNKNTLNKVIRDSGEYFEFAYDKSGYLSSVTDSMGRVVRYEIEDGKLTKVTRPDGTTFKYTYTLNGKLKSVENPRAIVTVENEFDLEHRTTCQKFPDGTTMQYEYDDSEKIVTLTERNGSKSVHYHDDLKRNVRNVYLDGEESFVYNSKNQKTQIKDKNGNITRLTYDNRGNVTGIINPVGTKVSLTYNAHNKPITASINGREKFHNNYDVKGNLVETIDAIGRKAYISYDEKGRPVIITVPDGSKTKLSYDDRGNVLSIEDAQGNTIRYSYDELNRVTEVIDAKGSKRTFSYDIMDNIIEETDAAGNKRSYAYNESGKLTEITDYDGYKLTRTYNVLNKPENITDKEGRVTRLEYDSMWNISGVITPDGAKTEYIYNENNRLAHVKDALGNTTKFTYDGMGNRLSIEDAEGARTEFIYNSIGQVISVKNSEGYITSYDYDDEGNLIKITDPLGNELHRSYDEAGQLIKEVLSDGESREYTYNSLGNISSVTTESGITTKYEYLFGSNKVISILYHDGNKETFTYDANGNLKTRTDRNGYILTYYYDSLNRLIVVEGMQGECKRYTYDVLGNVTSMTDALGNVTTYEYSLTGKLIKVTDALGNSAEYTYDVNDRLIGVWQEGTIEEPPRRTEYKRNILGQVETVTDALGQEEYYRYNRRGELIEKIDRDGYITKYDYNKNGDLEKLQYADDREVMLSYDALRHLSEIKDWLGTTSIVSDAMGRTKEVTYPDGQKVGYTYSVSGQRTGIVYPDGDTVQYVYDENARLSKLKNLDKKNNILVEKNCICYNYDNIGRLYEKTLLNGVSTTYLYNEKGLLSRLTHSDSEGILDEYIYEYDNAGNKTSIVKNRRGLEEESGAYGYGYDAIGRLSTVTKEEKLLREYSYDAFGNRKALKDYSDGIETFTSYSYNALNQLIHRVKETNRDNVSAVLESESYNYDRRGNLTQILKDGNIKNQYIYGAINRLEQASNQDGESARYIYNGLGHRVGKEEYSCILPSVSVPDVSIGVKLPQPEKEIKYLIDLTKQYHNMLEREVREVKADDITANASSIISSRQTFLWDGNVAAMIDDDRSMDFYLQDDLGSPIRLMDEEASLIDSYGYDEFGQDIYGNQGISQPFGYTGYQSDRISGTYFAQAREYSESLSRFCSDDAYVYMKFSDIRYLNLYGYCYNNPINFIDISGNDAYILYLPEWKNEAKNDKKKIKKEYGLKDDEIHMIAITDNQSFIDSWNNMGIEDGKTVDIDVVIVNTHAAYDHIGYGKNSNDALGKEIIWDLDEKSMDGLILYGCNAGHMDHAEENIAFEFSKIVDGAPVIASDGTVQVTNNIMDFFATKYKSKNDDVFISFLDDPSNPRDNKGWIIYKFDGTNVNTEVIGKKKLGLSEMLNYLEESCDE